jgi:hypothetical protein
MGRLSAHQLDSNQEGELQMALMLSVFPYSSQ